MAIASPVCECVVFTVAGAWQTASLFSGHLAPLSAFDAFFRAVGQWREMARTAPGQKQG
jgi:hypothetical protein